MEHLEWVFSREYLLLRTTANNWHVVVEFHDHPQLSPNAYIYIYRYTYPCQTKHVYIYIRIICYVDMCILKYVHDMMYEFISKNLNMIYDMYI